MEQMDDGGRMVSSLRKLLKYWEISFMSVIISNLKKKKKNPNVAPPLISHHHVWLFSIRTCLETFHRPPKCQPFEWF